MPAGLIPLKNLVIALVCDTGGISSLGSVPSTVGVGASKVTKPPRLSGLGVGGVNGLPSILALSASKA